MYLPRHFEVKDPALLHQLIERWSFATLVSSAADGPFATHLPLLLRRDAGSNGTLLGHVARANPQWRNFAPHQPVLAIFQGPHAYISPSWYAQHPSVPTWNYIVAHAYGVPRIMDDETEVLDLLRATVDRYESAFERPWPMIDDAEYLGKMVRGIVAFEILITRLEGKFKLSQNRSAADQSQVIAALADSADPLERELAAAMQRTLAATQEER